METILISHDDASCDGILNHAIRLYQPRTGARFNGDSILLAAAVAARPHQTVLELGMGVGAVSIALVWRMKKMMRVTGIERQKILCDYARHNIIHNDMIRQCRVVHGDIQNMPPHCEQTAFDHIVTNPPWRDGGVEMPSALQSRRQAFHQTDVSLRDWTGIALRLAARRATITMIVSYAHKPLLQSLFGDAGFCVTARPVRAHRHQESRRLIVKAEPASLGHEWRELRPLTLHQDNHADTQAAHDILRGGKALSWHD